MTQQIELTLNAEIVSVDGVVNGESYAFTLTDSVDGMGIWTAAVTRAENDIYRVSITAVNGMGVTSQFSTIIYYGLHLIADRTQEDVNRVNVLARKGWENMTPEERSAWENGLKGAYNCTDLNRVQSAVRYLRDRFAGGGYFVELSEPKTWTTSDTPTLTDMLKTTPPAPDSMVGFNYVKANNIEQILLDVDMLLSNMITGFVRSGDIFGGELH